jgi:RNA-directed DNA polymerase
MDNRLWQMLWKWSLRRHPNKGKDWVAKKYFHLRPEDGWRFRAFSHDSKGNKQIVTLLSLSSITIERHIKVKGKSSPDDPTLEQYWQQRQTQYGKTYWVKGSKLYKIAQNQQWKCPVCGDQLFNGEALNTHHRIPIKLGGTDSIENLIHLHDDCHRQIHRSGCSELAKA